jgi:hypothetical protein
MLVTKISKTLEQQSYLTMNDPEKLNRIVCCVRYKGKILLFLDQFTSHKCLLLKMIKFFESVFANNKNIGFTSFDEVTCYEIPNDNISLINFDNKYINLLKVKEFKQHEIIIKLNNELPKGLRLEDCK